MLSTKVLASSPLAKILTDDMTDELMHELSTMTEIALLWNPVRIRFDESLALPILHLCTSKIRPLWV